MNHLTIGEQILRDRICALRRTFVKLLALLLLAVGASVWVLLG